MLSYPQLTESSVYIKMKHGAHAQKHLVTFYIIGAHKRGHCAISSAFLCETSGFATDTATPITIKTRSSTARYIPSYLVTLSLRFVLLLWIV